MATALESALAYVLANEGTAFVADPLDKGRASKFGITQATLSSWRGKPQTERDVRMLTLSDAQPIYKARYWDVMRLNDVGPQATSTALLDMGVLNGTDAATKLMQHCLAVAEDGVMGPVTIAAINAQPSATLVPAFAQAAQLRFLSIVRKDGTQAKWLAGWLNRATKLMILAV